MAVEIPSKQFTIWQRLYTRFTLEPAPVLGSQAAVSTVIVPVTQVDALLEVRVAGLATLDLDVAGAILIAGYTVPAGKRARLLYGRKGTTTASTTISATIGGVTLILSDAATAGVFLANGAENIILDEGDILGVISTDDVGDGARQFMFVVMESESF